LLHQVYELVKALDLNAITELVPATPPKQANGAAPDKVEVWGDPVTDAQMPGVEQLLKSALGQLPANATR
jgi:hypothetical protein